MWAARPQRHANRCRWPSLHAAGLVTDRRAVAEADKSFPSALTRRRERLADSTDRTDVAVDNVAVSESDKMSSATIRALAPGLALPKVGADCLGDRGRFEDGSNEADAALSGGQILLDAAPASTRLAVALLLFSAWRT